MSVIDELLANARHHADSFQRHATTPIPSRRVTVVTCMDARIDVFAILGLRDGEAHILRNGGGLVTDDILRSLAISQRALGTTEIMLIQHTQCGMLGLDDEVFAKQIESETGVRPSWRAMGISSIEQGLADSLARIRAEPAIPHRAPRAFVYDVDHGSLNEVV